MTAFEKVGRGSMTLLDMTQQSGTSSEEQELKVRAAYVSVNSGLTKADLISIKFLLADTVDVNSLEKAVVGTEVFWSIRDQSLLTLDFLADLLTVLDRRDLLSELPGGIASELPRQPLPSQLISSRRLYLYLELVDRNLTLQEMKDIAFVHKLGRDIAELEWPHLVNGLLRKFPLPKGSDKPAVVIWVQKHIYGHKFLTVEETKPEPSRSISVVDESTRPSSSDTNPDQIDSIDETADTDRPHVKAVDVQIMSESYDVAQCIGRGRTAAVYKGRCPQLRWLSSYGDLEVAVKVLNTQGLPDRTQFYKFFQRELLSAHVLRSPFVLPLICYSCPPSETGDARYSDYALMFPLMRRGDLHSCLFSGDTPSAVQNLPWDARVRIAHQVAVALQTLHSNIPGRRQAIAHRDVKSANILLDEYGNARLADTGLARELADGKSGVSMTAGPGTLGYCHPDACEGPYYAHYDWFSFGVVLLELLCQKPAATKDKPFLYKWLHKKKLLCYQDYSKLSADMPKGLVDEYHELWMTTAASRQAADWFFHIAVHCISADREEKRFSCNDSHRSDWLGFSGSSGDSSENEKPLCWTELRPVTMLRELCSSNGISLFNNAEWPMAADSASSARDAPSRCASCFVTLSKKDVSGLHTLSSMCQPNECLWYCRTCLRSGEPLYCLKHGRAQPIIGGENAHVIAVSGSGKGADIFKQDCQRLRDTLTDARFAGISYRNVTLVAAPLHDEVKLSLLSLTLQLEERVISAAIARSSRDLCPGLRCPETLEEAVRSVCTFVRKKAALQKLATRCSDLQVLPSSLTEQQKRSLLSNLVDTVWKRTELLSPDSNVKAEQLLAMSRLWSYADTSGPCHDALGTTEKQHQHQQQLCCMLDVAKMAEKEQLAKLARRQKDKLADCDLLLRRLADECFSALISSCCIPESADELLSEHEPSVLMSVTCLTQCIGESKLATAARSIASSLRPLTDGLVWYHYCGHASSGQGRLPDVVLPKDLLEAAGRHVSNVIVTLDCCHADAIAPKLDFHVDGLAPYSGYAVLSSCTAAQESQFGRSTAFTEFLIGGLRSANDDCCQAFERAFQGHTCSKHDCQACKVYRSSDGSRCPACNQLRSDPGGCLQLVDIFEYVKAHLCADLMSPVLYLPHAKRHLPLAYRQPRRPTYDVHVRLPSADRLDTEIELVVPLNDIPPTVAQLKTSVLKEILCFMKNNENGEIDRKLASMMACQLAKCNLANDKWSVNTAEVSSVSHNYRDCIDPALQLLDSPDMSSSSCVEVQGTSQAQGYPSTLQASVGQTLAYGECAMQCQDRGDAPCLQPTTGAPETSAVSSAKNEALHRVLSKFVFHTDVSEVETNKHMQTMFRRGFAIHCSFDL